LATKVPDSSSGGNAQQNPHSIVLFDGVCNFCNQSVRFIVARDPRSRFRFAPLSSPIAESLIALSMKSMLPGEIGDSIVLVERGRILTRSCAALRIARRLCFPWPVFYALIVVPRPIRDCLYDYVARNRYRWFGRAESCMLPSAELRSRFLN